VKTVSVVVPVYNEEQNIRLMYQAVCAVFRDKLPEYNFEIIYIDNYSADGTRAELETLTDEDKRVKYIFNATNFGFVRSSYYGLLQATGDCVVMIFADMQDPPELIEQFVRQWEQGHKIVVGVKTGSNESKIVYAFRSLYYKFIKKICAIDHISQFNGFGLYDASFIQELRLIDDPLPYFRGIVAEMGPPSAKVYYQHGVRKKGKSSFNFFRMYDVAMLGITSYSKAMVRLSMFLGLMIAAASVIVALITLIFKLFRIIDYPIGTAATIFGIFFFGSVQLVFIGILGEYISNINIRTMKRPLVSEEKRKNFDV
jgi:polyisoprenyl-phosphate glycosyltransferase